MWRKVPKKYTKHAESVAVAGSQGTAALGQGLAKACRLSTAVAAMPVRAFSKSALIVAPVASDNLPERSAASAASPPNGGSRPVRPQYKRSNTRKISPPSKLKNAELAILATAHSSARSCVKDYEACDGGACDGGVSTAGKANATESCNVEPISPVNRASSGTFGTELQEALPAP